MVTCVRRIQFCSGHRVMNHESKCRNVHGHNYVAYFHAVAPQLDSIGRVIDFSVLKDRLGGWIDKHWDHAFIINELDRELLNALNCVEHEKPLFVAPFNPTAEEMAKHLLYEIAPIELKGTGVTIVKVVLWETENCFVEVSL